jgi:hypothetical protein
MLHKVKTLFKFKVIMCDPYVVIYINPLFHSGKKIILQGRSFHPVSGFKQLRQLPLG